MNVNKIILLIIISLNVNLFFGQETSAIKESKNYLTFDLLKPAVSYVPRWTFGYHRKISENLIIGSDIGIGNKTTSIGIGAENAWTDENYFSIEFSPEIRYLINTNVNLKYFIALDLSYVYHEDTFINNYFNNDPDTVIRYDSADYQRTKYTATVNYGLISPISEHFAIESKIGFGIKNRNVSYTNIQNPRIESFEEESLFSVNNHIKELGNKLKFEFNVDVKIVYQW